MPVLGVACASDQHENLSKHCSPKQIVQQGEGPLPPSSTQTRRTGENIVRLYQNGCDHRTYSLQGSFWQFQMVKSLHGTAIYDGKPDVKHNRMNEGEYQ